jgi:two-component system cell cycle sensor histidine kinase/response regulator CckA
MGVQTVVSESSHGRRIRWLADVVIIAILYVVGARLRLVFPFNSAGASWVWLPSGVSLAGLLLLGRNRWPGIALGSLLAGRLAGNPALSTVVAMGYATGEALLANWLIARGGRFDFGLGTVRDVLRFSLAGVAAAAATATIGAWNFTVLTRVDAHYALSWVTFFTGDVAGMLALAPALLVWGGTSVSFGGTWRRLEFTALLCAAFAVGALVFGQTWPTNVVLPIAYLSFPLMVWSAFRFGQAGGTAVIAVLGTFALAGSAAGLGPFATALNRGEAVLVAGFMNVISITALMLAAVVQERASAQAEYRSTETRFRAFMQFSPAIAFMKTADGRYVFGNDAWARQFGAPPSALMGKKDADLWPRETATYFRESDKQTLARKGPVEVTENGPGLDGLPRWWTTLKFLVEEDPASLPLVGGITIDVTPRMRAEEALRASEDRYRSLVELAGSVIVVVGSDGRIGEFNRAAEAFFGLTRDEAVGQDFLRLCVPENQRPDVLNDFAHIREGEAVRERESLLPAADGTRRSFLWNATRLLDGSHGQVGILIIGQDISELRRLETQLLLSQRMEGIGRLAGGIAHDFNNLLTAILGHAEMARGDVAEGDPAQSNITEITRAAQRAADLTRQLLAFARRQIIEPKIVDLNSLVLNVDRMLRRLLGEDVDLLTVPDPGLWRVRIDPGQFEQVLVNLAVNARDAMPGGGRLLIETSNVYLDADFARNHATVQPGPHILLSVTDTGTGMDQEVLAHIFEPFFTTKEVGKGTGLGLATCYGIVKQNRGSIWVYTERGLGTTFKIYLPRAEAPLEPIEAAANRPVSEIHGTETVLLVEDETVVRDLAADALRRYGYQVLSAATGGEALEIAQQAVRGFDVLVTDVVMPQMSGQQLAERLLATRRDLKVLFISGYSDSSLLRASVYGSTITLLQKPFTPGQLVQKVRELLDTERVPRQPSLPLSIATDPLT